MGSPGFLNDVQLQTLEIAPKCSWLTFVADGGQDRNHLKIENQNQTRPLRGNIAKVRLSICLSVFSVRLLTHIQAYFEETLESVMGIVHRPAFEARLRAHFMQGALANDDPGWYALRNAVYASGCRAEYSKVCHLVGFEEAQERGWRYFENALSVQAQLLYGQTEITAVQALIAMVCIRFPNSKPPPLMQK